MRFGNPVLDTLLLSAVVYPEQESHSLEAIAGRLGLKALGRHTALGDAIMTGEIFLRMLPLLEARRHPYAAPGARCRAANVSGALELLIACALRSSLAPCTAAQNLA